MGVCKGMWYVFCIIFIYLLSTYFYGTKLFPSNEPQIYNNANVGKKQPYDDRYRLAKS
jgi:hypothetical protein